MRRARDQVDPETKPRTEAVWMHGLQGKETMSVLALIALGWVGWAFLNSEKATAGIRAAPFPVQPVQAAPGTGAQSTTGNRFHRSNRNQCGSCRTPRTMLGEPWVPRPRHGPGPTMDPLTAGHRAAAAGSIGVGPQSKTKCLYTAGGLPIHCWEVADKKRCWVTQPNGPPIETECFDEVDPPGSPVGGWTPVPQKGLVYGEKVKPKCWQINANGPPTEIPCPDPDTFEDM